MQFLNTLSDNELIDLLRGGNEAAFTEIYQRYWEKMADYAIRLTRSEDEGADIVQEMFVSLWRRKSELEIKSTLGAYLIKGTRNLSLKYIEKNITKHQFLERLSDSMQGLNVEFDDKISLKHLQARLDGTIEKLPKKMKAVYVLSRDEQLSHREIAQRLGIAENTVKKQISNALKILSDSIKTETSATIAILLLHLLK